jgi:hypothetical protein
MMGVDFHKTSHVIFFAAFLPTLSFGAGWLCAQLIPNAPFWVETLSPLAAYGLFFGLFDKYLWHWPIFRWVGIVCCPDVRGRWLGEQVSSFKNNDGKHLKSRVILEIDQTFTGIHACTYYRNWQSVMSVTQFADIAGTPTLIMMFDAEPKAIYDGDARSHKGVSKLTQNPDKTLVGTYFNAAGNHGEQTFRRTRYTLHHTFDSIGNKKK